MSSLKKLQAEIDSCLKKVAMWLLRYRCFLFSYFLNSSHSHSDPPLLKVTEGRELFEDIWQKFHSASRQDHKVLYFADLCLTLLTRRSPLFAYRTNMKLN
jgi:hypothetical protein